jgi:F-type H+-transporting ATPase subunit alpha
MKLDYLQFLELEVFTRFGSRLEASMEAKLTRGRVLRELLKQDRLAPMPIEFHLAWLTGFQHGLFDKVPVASIPGLLGYLAERVEESDLTLESREKEWTEKVSHWLDQHMAT